MARKQTPESGVLKACLDYLAAKRVWFQRQNTGAMRDGNRFIRFNRPGTADILCTPWKDGRQRILWVEVKAPNGRQSEAQKDWQCEVEMQGHDYLLCRDVSELIAWIESESL